MYGMLKPPVERRVGWPLGLAACGMAAACGGVADGPKGGSDGGVAVDATPGEPSVGSGGNSAGDAGASGLDVEGWCGEFARVGCPLPNCEKVLQNSAARAVARGCTHELRQVFDCVFDHPIPCVGGTPEVPAECEDLETAAETCVDQ